MPRRAKFIKVTEPRIVKVIRHAKYPVATIPVHMAEHLGIIEGLSTLEVKVQDGKLIYTPMPHEGFLENAA